MAPCEKEVPQFAQSIVIVEAFLNDMEMHKIFHYTQTHSENFQNLDFFNQLPTLARFWAGQSRRRQQRGTRPQF